MGTKQRIFSPLPPDLSLEELVPDDSFYRRLEARLDLSFVRELVRPLYARGGRPSVDPVVLFRLQLVMFFEDLRSERRLMRAVADRLSLRWYLGYDLFEPLPDARLAEELGLVVRRDALLRRAKSAPLPDAGKVWVLGVDDFAFKKGHAYGTVLVDLEGRRVVGLLPERSQEGLVAWLKNHPEVEFAARDRLNIYREALAKGAPGAVQVTDRWHLLHNLAHVLENLLLQKLPVLREAAMPGPGPEDRSDGAFASGPVTPNRPRNHDRKIEEAARRRHERLVRQWGDIRRLYLAGADLRHICEMLGVSARTVYRYKDLTEPPPRRAYKRKKSVLDPYVPYLVARWNEGCRNGKKLYREIRERGYRKQRRDLRPLHGPDQTRRVQRETAFLGAAGQEGFRRGAVSHLQERGRAVHTPGGEALRGAEGVLAEAPRSRRGPRRRTPADAGIREDGKVPRRREARRVARGSGGLPCSRDEALRGRLETSAR